MLSLITSRDVAYIKATQTLILSKMEKVMAILDDLKASVAAEHTVVASAVTLIQGFSAKLAEISAQLAAAGVDTSALTDLKASVDADTQSLADAVAENTAVTPPAP